MDKTYEVRAKPSYCMTCKTCNKRKPPTVLQNVFPHGRCIIDCTKVFIETPSSLDTQAQCWWDYKHHCTLKFLVAITPNGMFFYISPCYGGRASDTFIFNNCAFISWLEPNDQVMAERGFKVKGDLMVVQARLIIYSSEHMWEYSYVIRRCIRNL
jgi:hypothetical protein